VKLSTALAILAGTRQRGDGRPLSFFEFWPDWLFYFPVAAHWIALGLRHGNFMLPTAANPAITAGGLCGESKREILDQVRGPVRNLLARYTAVVASPEGAEAAEEAGKVASIGYPLIAKPDIGCNGTGVRLLRDRRDLQRYLRDFPAGERVMLQELVVDEGEAGVFYVRHPDEAVGHITSITLKHVPLVTGDGRATLRELILADPRAGRVSQLYLPRLAFAGVRRHRAEQQSDVVAVRREEIGEFRA